MRILVVGAGSTGGYFGGRLAQAGRDVTFLVRPARAARLREQGLQIISPHGDFTVAPKLVTADALGGAYDLVLLSVKAYALEAAMADMAAGGGAGDDDPAGAERHAACRRADRAVRAAGGAGRPVPGEHDAR